MATSEERREVARKLRDCIFYAKGYDLNGDCDMWSDNCVETRCTLYNDIAACIEEGGNVNLSAEEVFTHLADLIDPTCEVESVDSTGGLLAYNLSCGDTAFAVQRELRPSYCPSCGARVVDGGDA